MAAGTFTAQMAASPETGRWRLYIVVFGATDWPTYTFDGPGVPTVEQRSRALAALGYASTDGPGWDWTEDVTPVDDPVLIAATTVRRVSP
ncbi:DUF6303 family protein [Streptomyces zhihengii]|uniref:DUF6303 family protein n=1 Tax=Streptomyces zhihengii TaxID=1818004 RepID=UPI00369B7E23